MKIFINENGALLKEINILDKEEINDKGRQKNEAIFQGCRSD